MTRLMYDSVNAANIPRDAAIVAGYIDGRYAWTQKEWDLFPNAIKMQIAVFSFTNAGTILDVEIGASTPQQAPGWVARRRNAGVVEPWVYCNESTWVSVVTEFTHQKVPQPLYWIAHYDNDPTIHAGAIAKQYATNAAFDTSSVNDYVPGMDIMTISQDDANIIARAIINYSVPTIGPDGQPTAKQVNLGAHLGYGDLITNDTWGAIAGIKTIVDALQIEMLNVQNQLSKLPTTNVHMTGTFQMDNNTVTPPVAPPPA